MDNKKKCNKVKFSFSIFRSFETCPSRSCISFRIKVRVNNNTKVREHLPSSVDLWIVDEKENEETRDAFVIEQLTTSKPHRVGRGQQRSGVRVRCNAGSTSQRMSSPSVAGDAMNSANDVLK
jgi:hypothetical protein